jgi:hydrogenase maturation protease
MTPDLTTMTQHPRILIACIGNIFLGDDGFGVEVAQRLLSRTWPEGVRVVDFGIRAFDLAFALMEDDDATILVDAAPRGGSSGTLYIIEPDLRDPADSEALGITSPANMDAHTMNPMRVLQMARTMGAKLNRILLVGCEPESFGPENEGRMGLSDPVQAAVAEAVTWIEDLVENILSTNAARAAQFNFEKEQIQHGFIQA